METVVKTVDFGFATSMGRDDIGSACVVIYVKDQAFPVDLLEARRLHEALGHAIDAGVSYEFLYRFFTYELEFDDDRALQAIRDFQSAKDAPAGSRPVPKMVRSDNTRVPKDW